MKIKGKNDTVIRFAVYAPWEYTKEEEDLNEASKRGLQLLYGGGYHSRFGKDDKSRYIYQLDYNPKIDDPLRYREAFEEQGWEYINSTFNGWHYFRKEYREGMQEHETKIYTDEQSLHEMQNRWIRLLKVLGVIYAVMCVFYLRIGIVEKELVIFMEGIIFLLFASTFGLGIRSARLRRSGQTTRLVIPIQIMLTIAILILAYVLFRGFFW